MLRPSLSSTQSVSSDTLTFSAKGTSISMAEVLIPGLHKLNLVITHKFLNPRNLDTGKSTTAMKPNRI